MHGVSCQLTCEIAVHEAHGDEPKENRQAGRKKASTQNFRGSQSTRSNLNYVGPNLPSATMTSIKGLSQSDTHFDGSSLRVAIVHARWNKPVIDALVAGAVTKLKERGVKESNIVVQTVPGSFELPLACSKYVVNCYGCWPQ